MTCQLIGSGQVRRVARVHRDHFLARHGAVHLLLKRWRDGLVSEALDVDPSDSSEPLIANSNGGHEPLEWLSHQSGCDTGYIVVGAVGAEGLADCMFGDAAPSLFLV